MLFPKINLIYSLLLQFRKVIEEKRGIDEKVEGQS